MPKLPNPVIRSAPSDFDVLLSSLPALTTHLVELADRFNQVFSDENVRSFNTTFANVRLASEHLPGTLSEVQSLVADLRRARPPTARPRQWCDGVAGRAFYRVAAGRHDAPRPGRCMGRAAGRLCAHRGAADLEGPVA